MLDVLRPGLPFLRGLALLVLVGALPNPTAAEEPAKLNPFGKAPTGREDAIAGYLELSDGTILTGRIYLTRGKRLKIYDEKQKRQREVPLTAVQQIEGAVQKEWMEKEWRFREAASDQKVYTGQTYPAREYVHTITLGEGRTISGPLAEIVFLEPTPDSPGQAAPEPQRFLLNKRQKGEPGHDLNSLIYVRRIKLGDQAFEEGKRKAAERTAPRGT
jgi:hypothetical protein